METDRDKIKAYAQSSRQWLLKRMGLTTILEEGDKTAEISRLISPLDLNELMWHYRLFAWAQSRRATNAPPKKEIEKIRRALKKLLKQGWLTCPTDIDALIGTIYREILKTERGETLLIRNKNLKKNFPMDFLVFILSLYIPKQGRNDLIGAFLSEQGLVEGQEEGAVRKRLKRLEGQVYRLGITFSLAISEINSPVLSRYLDGPEISKELSEAQRSAVRWEVRKPFEYFLPSELKKSWNIS